MNKIELSNVYSLMIDLIHKLRSIGKPSALDVTFTESQLEILSSRIFWDVAERNKIPYLIARVLQVSPQAFQLGQLVKREDEISNFSLIRKTLSFVNEIFSQAELDFLIVKTHTEFPYPTQDVDVLVHPDDYERATKVLLDRGASTVDNRFRAIQSLGLGEPDFSFHGLLKIDLYADIPWRHFPVVDESFAWESSREVFLSGVPCRIPNREADIISLLVSSVFTDRKLTIADFSHISSLFEKGLNVSKMEMEAENRGWGDAFRSIIRKICIFNEMVSKGLYDVKWGPFPFKIPLGSLLHVSTQALLRDSDPRMVPHNLANLGFRSLFNPTYVAFQNRLRMALKNPP
jgi:hypothetical protein